MSCSYKNKRKNDLTESILKQFLKEMDIRITENPFHSMEPPADYSPSFVDTTKVERKPEGTENIPPNILARKRVEPVVKNYYKTLKKAYKNDYKNRIGKVLETYFMIKEGRKIEKKEPTVKISPIIKEKDIV